MLNTQIRGDKPQAITVSCPDAPATTLALEPGGTMADLGVSQTAPKYS
jgi:hypothetical protein